MRITFVAPPVSMAGGTRVVAIYAKILGDMGHDVLIVSPPRRRVSFFKKLKLFIKEGTWPQTPRYDSHVDGLGISHKILDRYRPITENDLPDGDVVIATWWETAEWVFNMSPGKGKKFYFMQDYGAPGQQLEKIIPTWKLGIEMITISKWLNQLVLSYVPDACITTVLNSVDFNVFRSEPRTKQKVPTFGFVYVEKPSKGHDTVLNAFRLAREKNPSIKLLLFGSAAPGDQLPKGAQFYLKPSDEEVRQIYASCDAWLFASVIEGFGLPILEAMACRTPVIATPAGCSLDVIDETNGFLVPAEDPVAMSDALLTVAELPEDQWRSLSDNAYNSISSYTWDDAARKFHDIISNQA